MLKHFFKKIPFLCKCAGSGFIDKDHRHIVTGDLQIVGNNKLRKVFTKGPKHKKPTIFHQEKLNLLWLRVSMILSIQDAKNMT